MLNNKGFTLIEILASLITITFITIIIVSFSSNTFSINRNRAYDIMKENIYKISQVYIKECDAGLLACDLNWNNNSTEFYVEDLKNNGYFKNTKSPLDGKDIGKCILIKVSRSNGVNNIELVDKCY